MVIKRPSVITLANGQKWILVNAKKINDKDFGLLAEIPQQGKPTLALGVAEMQISDGQARIAFYNGPDSTDLMNTLLKI